MKAHELAKKLLEMPDVDIVVCKNYELNAVLVDAERLEIVHGCKPPPEKENNDAFVEIDEWIPVDMIVIR